MFLTHLFVPYIFGKLVIQTRSMVIFNLDFLGKNTSQMVLYTYIISGCLSFLMLIITDAQCLDLLINEELQSSDLLIQLFLLNLLAILLL